LWKQKENMNLQKKKTSVLDHEKHNNGYNEILTIVINITVYGFILPKSFLAHAPQAQTFLSACSACVEHF
jgi:hypothetical protein